MNLWNRTAGLVALLLLCGMAASVQAQDKAPEKWQFAITPYLWLSGIKGDIGAKDRQIPVDAKFADIFDKLKFAGMINFEARQSKLSLLFDLVYTDVRDDADVNVPIPSQGITVPANIDAKTTSLILSPAVGYRLAEDKSGYVDALVGARIWFQDTKLTARSDAVNPVSVSSSPSWVDPTIGFRARTRLDQKWSAGILGDYGGFGVGSKSTWQLVGTFHLQVGGNNNVVFGYRALDVDYRKSGTTYNTTQHGPVIGFTFGL